MKVAHVITDLNVGGAETMLYKLLSGTDKSYFDELVVSLTTYGPVAERIRKLGIEVKCLGLKRGVPDPLGVLKLRRILKQEKIDLIQTWMYHADLIGGLAAKMAGIPVIWNIRNSTLDSQVKWTTRMTVKTSARLSPLIPEKIICCSTEACRIHVKQGYMMKKMVVIPNGFDLAIFTPNRTARANLRQELGLAPDTLLIGNIARYDPQKDHKTFLQAVAEIYDDIPRVHFVFAGDGISWDNDELVGYIYSYGIKETCHLLGRRDDIPYLTSALDISCLSSSYGEAFPNVLGEAMACGVPCVTTDVGDSALIVGDTGIVVPPQIPKALAEAWKQMIEMGDAGRRALGEKARKRVQNKFNLLDIVSRYEELYRQILA